MSRPRLHHLDQLSLGLPSMICIRILDVLHDLNRPGTTLLLVVQNARMALRLAHRGYVLETGTLLKTDRAEALLADPTIKDAYLGD